MSANDIIDFTATGGSTDLNGYLRVLEVLGDDQLWEKCKPIVEKAYSDRNSEMLSAQWQACLEYSALEELPNCIRPLHVIAFDQDMQTPPSSYS